MKKLAALAFIALALGACKKEEKDRSNEPTLPIARNLYLVSMSTGDTSDFTVYLDRPTMLDVLHYWTSTPSGLACSLTPGGPASSIYRNSTIRIYSNADEACDVVVRVDDILTQSFHVEPSVNGELVLTISPNW